MPFVFNDQFELDGGERDLSERMAMYWTTFARTGNPNGDTLSKVEQGGVLLADGAEEGEGRGEGAAGGGPPPPHHHRPPHRPTGPENCSNGTWYSATSSEREEGQQCIKATTLLPE